MTSSYEDNEDVKLTKEDLDSLKEGEEDYNKGKTRRL